MSISTSGWADGESSARSSFETWIFSGIFRALFDGSIGTPLFEIWPLYKFSKSSLIEIYPLLAANIGILIQFVVVIIT